MEEMINIGRRPSQSEMGPEQVVTTVAPIRDIATIRPSMVGSLSNRNSLFMYKIDPAWQGKTQHSSIKMKLKLMPLITKEEKKKTCNGGIIPSLQEVADCSSEGNKNGSTHLQRIEAEKDETIGQMGSLVVLRY